MVFEEDRSLEEDISLSGRTGADQNDKLIIAGSGRVAWYVYKYAAMLGYQIIVVDNMAETLTQERFPEAVELRLGDVVQLLQTAAIDANTSVVIVTHHHEYDEAALLAVINSTARYIGIMSNRRAVTSHLSKLESLGIDDALIARVYTPIGLDIGGQKAAEIALAAVAEIQAVKYGRPGGSFTIKQSNRGREKRDELF